MMRDEGRGSTRTQIHRNPNRRKWGPRHMSIVVASTSLILLLLSLRLIAVEMYQQLAKYPIVPDSLYLTLVRGSVVHFKGKTAQTSAIVNAANAGCLGGGGVDGAISNAGGEKLFADRENLPILRRLDGAAIRCEIGKAVLTGPGDYGELKVRYVIHAVGPNYMYFPEDKYHKANALLSSAYRTSLNVANEAGIEQVGFSLLSAGIFRGKCSLHDVLTIAVKSITSWGRHIPKDCSVSEIVVFAYTPLECRTLKKICDKEFGVVPETKEETLGAQPMDVDDDGGVKPMDISLELSESAPSDEEESRKTQKINEKEEETDPAPSDEENAENEKKTAALKVGSSDKIVGSTQDPAAAEKSGPTEINDTNAGKKDEPVRSQPSETVHSESANKKIKTEDSSPSNTSVCAHAEELSKAGDATLGTAEPEKASVDSQSVDPSNSATHQTTAVSAKSSGQKEMVENKSITESTGKAVNEDSETPKPACPDGTDASGEYETKETKPEEKVETASQTTEKPDSKEIDTSVNDTATLGVETENQSNEQSGPEATDATAKSSTEAPDSGNMDDTLSDGQTKEKQ